LSVVLTKIDRQAKATNMAGVYGGVHRCWNGIRQSILTGTKNESELETEKKI
jgi:hypothetical protein